MKCPISPVYSDSAALVLRPIAFCYAVDRWQVVANARDWPRSIVRAHQARQDDGLMSFAPGLDRIGQFADLIAGDPE